MKAPETLDEIRDEGSGASFPCELLVGNETALALFAAGFFGRQDGYWIADAGLTATCIDTDADRLDAMAAVYPTDWDFIQADVYKWVPKAVGQWDVVSVDCPTGHFDQCAEMLPEFCRLARRVVVLGADKNGQSLQPPAGWEMTGFRHRSDYVEGGVFWSVVERR